MRLNTTAVKLAVAALFAGSLGVAAVGVAHAAQPQAPTKMAEPAKGSETDGDYVQNLRSVRRALNDNKKLLLEEKMSDRSNYRHDAVEAIDKAVDAIDKEVVAYDKDMKTGK